MVKPPPARLLRPPKTVDLSKHFDLFTGEPITVNINDSSYLLPPYTRLIRYGLTQEGFMVEYQDGDGDWQGAPEATDD